jgi:hypothetical protein
MTPEFKRQLVSFPTPLMRAILRNDYDRGDSQFSVTQLISAPQRTWLAGKGEKQETPYGAFHAMLGTAIHAVLEKNVDEESGEIAERRLYHDFSIGGGFVRVSGQIDFYENKVIFDYKFTGGVQDDMKPEHYKQVQMNGRLAELNGIIIENVAVVYIQRDWSFMQSQVNPNYPQSPFKIFIKDYDQKLASELFAATVADHLMAAQGNPRACTPDEQWAKPDTFALMKPGAKRASKVCYSMAEAEAEKKPGQFIQTRKGERTFCSSFCGYSHLCPQFLRENMEMVNTNDDF